MRKMRFFAVLLAVLMLLGMFSACQTKKGSETTTSAAETTKAEDTTTTASVDKITAADFDIRNPRAAEDTSNLEMSDIDNMTAPGVLPIVIDTVELSINVSASNAVYVQSYGDDNEFNQYILDNTGIHVTVTPLSTTNSDDTVKFNLAMASGESLPDLYLGTFGSLTKGEISTYGADNKLINITDFFDKYGYYFYQTCVSTGFEDRYSFMLNYAKGDDGELYCFPSYYCDMTNAGWESLWMNTTWLDTLGLEAPETTDELYDTLVAFRDNDPNGNGTKDEIPLMGCSTSWRASPQDLLMNSFTYWAVDYWFAVNQEDDTIYAPFVTDKFQEGLAYVNKLVEDGLCSTLSWSQTNDDFKTTASIEEPNKVILGCIIGNPYVMSNLTNFYGLTYRCIPNVKGPDGFVTASWSMGNTVSYKNMITSVCKTPEIAFRLMDFMTNETSSFFQRYGMWGTDWIYWDEIEQADKDKYAEFTKSNMFTLDTAVWISQYTMKQIDVEWSNKYFPDRDPNRWETNPWHVTHQVHWGSSTCPATLWGELQNNGIAKAVPEDDPDYGKSLTSVDYYTNNKLNSALHPEKVMYELLYTAKESEENGEIISTVQQYYNNNVVRFILGDLDVEKDWQAYKDEIENIGLSQWLGVAQAAYDRLYK